MPTTQHRSNDDLVREFCIQADVTSATRVKYAAHLAELSRWLKHPLSPGRVEQLSHATRADLVHFMAYLLEGDRYAGSPHARRHGSMSASTRASFIGTLNAFYGYLVAVGVIDDNPAEAMPRPKKRYRRGITLSAD